MNLSTIGSELMDPAPIALELAVNGETVFPETLRVTLNGQDVTTAFHPGRADGADLDGLFFTDSSPVLDGNDLLATVIEGLDPISGLRVSDTDAIEFTVSARRTGRREAQQPGWTPELRGLACSDDPAPHSWEKGRVLVSSPARCLDPFSSP